MLMIVVGAKQVFGILDFIDDSRVLSIASSLTGCSMSEKMLIPLQILVFLWVLVF
jgi:hypothetical protein